MSKVHISSHKLGSRNGRARHDFDGDLHSDKFGIIFSGSSLILNLTNDERRCAVILDDEATAALAKRFAEWDEQ